MTFIIFHFNYQMQEFSLNLFCTCIYKVQLLEQLINLIYEILLVYTTPYMTFELAEYFISI